MLRKLGDRDPDLPALKLKNTAERSDPRPVQKEFSTEAAQIVLAVDLIGEGRCLEPRKIVALVDLVQRRSNQIHGQRPRLVSQLDLHGAAEALIFCHDAASHKIVICAGNRAGELLHRTLLHALIIVLRRAEGARKCVPERRKLHRGKHAQHENGDNGDDLRNGRTLARRLHRSAEGRALLLPLLLCHLRLLLVGRLLILLLIDRLLRRLLYRLLRRTARLRELVRRTAIWAELRGIGHLRPTLRAKHVFFLLFQYPLIQLISTLPPYGCAPNVST